MDKKYLSNDNIHAIINQMEVSMSKSADELVEMILEKRARTEQRAYESLKAKVIAATSKMVSDLSFQEEIDLEGDDLMALTKVTEALRELGYKFRFVEVQNNSGEILKHKLVISIQHLA